LLKQKLKEELNIAFSGDVRNWCDSYKPVIFYVNIYFIYLNTCSLSVLTSIFPGEPRLVGYVEAKDDGSGIDNWSYKTCKTPVNSSPPTNQHPTFYRPVVLSVAQPTVSKH